MLYHVRMHVHLPTDGERIAIVDLPAQPRDLFQSTRCLGRYFTDADAGHRRRISPVATTPRFRPCRPDILLDPPARECARARG